MSIGFPGMVQSCALDRWSPVIGDPTLMGWTTVAVYVLTAILALGVAARAPFPESSLQRERFFWAGLGLVLVALAVNKQLDLQSYLTAIGRCVAKLQGWYQSRRMVQAAFILALVATMAIGAVILRGMMRKTTVGSRLAVVGLLMVLTFVAVRAVGFHHVDALINVKVLHLRMNWVFELIGPIVIAAAGFWLLAVTSRAHPDDPVMGQGATARRSAHDMPSKDNT